ncbi:MAG TPA: PEP-CTERM system histidine kinase PrsK, partial [Rhodocyclaceae bacterium]|nr:PEP-CTERM system histidine kinase PrsK [Rhodocyclaceae bacterium]
AFLLYLQAPPTQDGDAAVTGSKLKTAAWILVIAGLLAQLGVPLDHLLPPDLSRFGLFVSLGMAVFALVLLEQLFRNVTTDSLWNVKPLALGLAAVFAFDVYLYSTAVLFNSIDADAFIIRGGVHALVVPLLALSTTRGRDWVAKIRLSQRAAFHSATLLLAGAYLLLVAASGYYVRYFGGDWGSALQLAAVFIGLLSFVVLAFSGTIRAKLRVWLGKHFFSYRYDYREEWLRFTQTLSTQESPQAMGQQVVRGLADLVESPAGALWLRDAGSGRFAQIARWNMPEIREAEADDSSLCDFLSHSGWVINFEEYRVFRGRYAELELPGWLNDLPNAWLAVPLAVGERLIGFVVLGSARTPIDVNWEINDLLKTAGRQAASFLAQMQATEALLEVRKFDAFNRMSAFVVHDLKNIVTQLALMLKNAERHRDNPEFQQDMLMTVENSVERMRQLMMQLREGATPPGTPVGVNLAEIVNRVHRQKRAQGRDIELQVAETVTTRGHEERIERIVGHVVQNALDATPENGRVWIRLERQAGQALVEVGDTGHGMSEEFVRERLFKPFQTTKQTGMGIGAYESFQYVQELGGRIQVESEIDKGTRVTLLLPLFLNAEGSDLRQTEAA